MTADATEVAAAAALVSEAATLASGPRHDGHRARVRALLEEAIDHARRHAGGRLARKAARVLARAYALSAEDALHGATQLSAGAQRAPTPEDCDDGWLRVAEIVAIAERRAREAAALGEDATPAMVRRAMAAGAQARTLLEARNHAYTFHADPGFSFGEGWYLAAAAVLAGVKVQIEPDQPLTAQAEAFLRAAGLADRLVPYRPRPRANKPLTAIVARAFREDAAGAQRRLRAAFLGDVPVATAVRDFVDSRLPAGDTPKVLVWIRVGSHQEDRNSRPAEVAGLVERARAEGLHPVLVGDALPGTAALDATDLVFFWKDPLFRGVDGRRAQLQFFEHLRAAHGVVGQVGVTTAGMDGPALLGLPTMYLTEAPNPRIGAWVGAVPGYEEIVRSGGAPLDRVAQGFARWRRA